MKDLLDSLRKQIVDRMSSPVFGSFAIAWIGWNHRYLIVLFSDLPVQERFGFAAMRLYPTEHSLWMHLLVYPAISSVAYIVVYPILSLPFLIYWDWAQRTLENLRNVIQKNKRLTVEESQKIRLDMIDQKARYDEIVITQAHDLEALRSAQKNSEEGRLKERIAVLENELDRTRAASAPQNPFGNISPDNFKGARDVLAVLAAMPNQRASKATILSKIKASDLRLQVYLDEAQSAQMIQWYDSSQSIVQLTQRGRQYTVTEKLDTPLNVP